jgi:hypothetical protein
MQCGNLGADLSGVAYHEPRSLYMNSEQTLADGTGSKQVLTMSSILAVID